MIKQFAECPLVPGQSRTYRIIATQYGTSWYHSHYSSQYSDGVFGPIVIDGPATADHDINLGVLPVQNWFYEAAISNIYKLSRAIIRQPTVDNSLINGTNKNAQGGGAYHHSTIEKGKMYRPPLVNTGTNDNFKIGLDKHNVTVFAMDFVPVVPFTTDWLFISMGERHDVFINADQPIDAYSAVSIFYILGAGTGTSTTASRSTTSTLLDAMLLRYLPTGT